MANRVVKNIKKNTKWNVTNEEIKSSLDMFGEDSTLANSYGIKYWNIYYKIAMDIIDRENEEMRNTILGDYIVFGESAMDISKRVSEEETIYYRVLLTERNIIIYALDHKCNLVNKSNLNIEDLRKIRSKNSIEENQCEEVLLIFNGKYFGFYGIDTNSKKSCNVILEKLKEVTIDKKIPIVDRVKSYVA